MLSRWLPVAGYVLVIFGLSSIPRGLRGPEVVHVDKLAHLAEYGVLGALLMRGLRPRVGGWGGRLAAALLLGVAVGVLDELYQRTVPGRSSSVFDMAADAAGTGLGALAWWARWRRGRGGAGTATRGGAGVEEVEDPP